MVLIALEQLIDCRTIRWLVVGRLVIHVAKAIIR